MLTRASVYQNVHHGFPVKGDGEKIEEAGEADGGSESIPIEGRIAISTWYLGAVRGSIVSTQRLSASPSQELAGSQRNVSGARESCYATDTQNAA